MKLKTELSGQSVKMDVYQTGESGEDRNWILDAWPKGTVWFRELIPQDLPWGDESLLTDVPASAAGAYGAKVGAYTRIDGERYEPGQIVVVESESDFRRLFPGLGGATDLVFPWYEKMVPASLLTPHRNRIDLASYRGEIRARFLKALALTAALVAIAFFVPDLMVLALIGALIYGLHPLVESGMAWIRRVDQLSVIDLNRRMVNFEFFRRWIMNRPTHWLKVGLGLLIAVFAGQLAAGIGPSIEAAALVKSRVLNDGEWWRIVTTGLMHGNVVHILFNGMALYSLGRVLVALVSPSLMSFVFLFTVVTGSLASLWLGPVGASVGASGGILGCLGFLLVVTEKFKALLPGYLRASLIQSTLVVAIFGLLGNQFIDNAAHGGGFLGGVLLGLFFYPWMRLAPQKTGFLVRGLSWLSLAVLLGGVGKIALELWTSR